MPSSQDTRSDSQGGSTWRCGLLATFTVATCDVMLMWLRVQLEVWLLASPVLKFPILLLVVWFQMHSDLWDPVFIFQQVQLVYTYQQSPYNLYVFPVRSFTRTSARFVDFVFSLWCDDLCLANCISEMNLQWSPVNIWTQLLSLFSCSECVSILLNLHVTFLSLRKLLNVVWVTFVFRIVVYPPIYHAFSALTLKMCVCLTLLMF